MAGERDNEARVLSAGLAIACHVGLGWWLLRPLPPAPDAGPEPGLQVTWIEPVASSSALSVPPPRPLDEALPTRSEVKPRASAEPAMPSTRNPEPGGREATGPATATLMEQGLQWAQEQSDAPDFILDPLRDPPRPQARERFAMRDPVTPEAVVRAIGRLIGGPDYETDPCPRIRRNLAALGPAGDSELMREEVRRLQSLCI